MVPGALPGGAAGGALKKVLTIAGAAICAAAIAFCTLPLVPWKPWEIEWPAVGGDGPLSAGAARVRIELPEHPVLAGYPGRRRARQATEPVYARAIVVQAGGARAVLAAVDTLLIPPHFVVLGECALVAATHTHSGPGGLWDNLAAGWIGAGAFDPRRRAAVETALETAVQQAAAAVAPAELQVARAEWEAGPAVARSEGPIDRELVALRLRRPGGPVVATAIVYAMHPTSVPRDVLSADWPGAVAAQLESATGAPALVLQGAVGNTTWRRDTPLARPVADEAEQLLSAAPPVQQAAVECRQRLVGPPAAQASVRVPWPWRRAVGNALGLGFDAPAPLTRLRIGPLQLRGVPGEPVGELGIAARPDVLVGLANGYVGYIETPERWREGKGEAGKTYFGPGLAHALGLSPR